jgi:hypothetical protein
MSSYIVTASTSVVLLDTSVLGLAQSAIVLLSSQMPPGRNVTVRDSLGYLSSPQSIIVSTTNNIFFSDGTSSIAVSQPFASMTFSSRDANTWNIVNTFGFPLYNTIANVSTLAVSTLIGNSLTIGGILSTNTIATNGLITQSTSQVFGPMFISTLVVGTQPSVSIPYETTPGYSAYIIGSANITSNVLIGGNVSTGGAAAFGGSVAMNGGLDVAQGAIINGNLTVQGSVITRGLGSFECQSAFLNSSLTVVGNATFSSNLFVNSNVQVGLSTITTTLNTSTIQINSVTGGYIQLGTTTVLRTNTTSFPGQTVFSINTPLYTPFVSTQTLSASSTIITPNLYVTSVISAPTLTNFTLGSAVIQNAQGSLITSSIQTNTLVLSNEFFANTITASSIITSNITASGSIYALSPGAYLSTGSINTSSLQVSQISTGSINAGVIQTPSVQVSSLFVSQTLVCGPGVSSINMQTATINNSLGSLFTSALYTSSITASSLSIQSGNIYSPNPIIFSTPSVYIPSALLNTFTTNTFNTSTVATSRIILGSDPGSNNNGPNFLYNPVAPSTNVLVSGGPGDYLSPYYLSNVIPVNQNPAVPYTTSIGFNANYFGGTVPPGLLIGYTASLFWAGQASSYLTIQDGPSLYGLFGSDQTITGTLPLSSFAIQAVLYGQSAINVTFSFQYSPNVNSIDPSTFIQFNNGSLNWNYALNGTTIQNSLNDMTIRNIYYYGSLNFASDPRIKENIQAADLRQCYDIISDMPLRRYKYIDEYCSTFNVSNTSRLGFLATDLLPHFPKSVHVSDTLFPEFSKDLMTIDTSQIDMAHLGTTKYLIEEVRRLESVLSTVLSQK